jgi:hypothetical protein
MTVKKRGLGRGLEALLVDVPEHQAAQSIIAQSLIEALQQENRRLLQEAQMLNELLSEFEALLSRLSNETTR